MQQGRKSRIASNGSGALHLGVDVVSHVARRVHSRFERVLAPEGVTAQRAELQRVKLKYCVSVPHA